MKIPTLLRSAFLTTFLIANCWAQGISPTIENTGDWMIISFVDSNDMGTDPVSYAIKKSSVLSVRFSGDLQKIKRADAPQGKKTDFDPESLKATPVIVEITTSELSQSGSNKTYQVVGLNYVEAVKFLKQVIELVSK